MEEPRRAPRQPEEGGQLGEVLLQLGMVEELLQPEVDEVPEGPCLLEVEELLQQEMEEVHKGPLEPGVMEEPCGETVPHARGIC